MTVLIILAGFAGMGLGYFMRHLIGIHELTAVEKRARQIVRDAEREAEATRREGEIKVAAEVLKAREEFEKSTAQRKKDLAAIEERMTQREMNLDRRVAMIEKKEKTLDEKIAEQERLAEELKKSRQEAERLIEEARAAVQRAAGMTVEEARNLLLSTVEKEARNDVSALLRKLQEEAKETAERDACRIVASAIQRYGGSHASEMMTSTVAISSEEMKGRIIGRDGRNIRALEAATGVTLIIDDTPEAVVISAFDPVRREIAKNALEELVADGRIHPARIEEAVAKAKERVEERMRLAGEEAAYSVGVQGLDPEVLRTLGRLRFRTSYTQNVLQHSLEVANLMGTMAGEMGLDQGIARRVGLFHDIGKALDHSVEGSHAVIGADFLRRHGEAAVVVNAVAAHHEEVEQGSIYAVLASAADSISGSRPGARAETTAVYVKRLEKLEAIADGFDGVKKSYAIQAGREVRVIVDPGKVDDSGAMILAKEISRKIESELQFPGQIRVTVVRETRCVEYAR